MYQQTGCFKLQELHRPHITPSMQKIVTVKRHSKKLRSLGISLDTNIALGDHVDRNDKEKRIGGLNTKPDSPCTTDLFVTF